MSLKRDRAYDKEKSSKKSKIALVSEDDLNNIRVYVLTRKVDDKSNDKVEANWKKTEYRVLKNYVPNHDEESEDNDCDVEPEKVVERILACNISEFNSGLSGEESKGVDVVRIGFLLENKSSIDIRVSICIDESKVAKKIVKSGFTLLVGESRNTSKGFAQDFIIRKSKLADDGSEVVDRELFNKLGTIRILIQKVKFIGIGYSRPDQSAPKISQSSEIKIKESMAKTGAAMSFNFGEVKKIEKKTSDLSHHFHTENDLMNLEIRYRNYIGYLLELTRANIPIEQKRTNQEHSSIQEIIEIESDDEDEIESQSSQPSQPSLTPSLPPFKSQSVMSKVKETVEQVESMSTENLIKFIKIIDEELHKSVKDPFNNEHIDGTAFLALSGTELKDLGIKIGEQIKIKQIIQQVRENR